MMIIVAEKNPYYTTKVKLETFDLSISFRGLHLKKLILNSEELVV